jgi:hypothetical protein
VAVFGQPLFDGEAVTQDTAAIVLARFSSGGIPDSSFGGTGTVALYESVADSAVEGYVSGNGIAGIATDDQGGGVVEVEAHLGQMQLFGQAELFRFTSSGALATDATTGFGPLDPATGARSGSVITPLTPQPGRFSFQPDGGIVLAGDLAGKPGYGLARYNPDGTPDSSFGPGGVTVVPYFPGGVTSDSNGKIVLVGETFDDDPVSPDSFIVQRVETSPPDSPAGVALSFTSSATAADPSALGYLWSVTKDGSPYALPAATAVTGTSFSFTPDVSGTYAVTLSATDVDGTTVSDSKTIAVTALTAQSLQQALLQGTASGNALTITATTPDLASAAFTAVDNLDPTTTPAATVVVDLGGQTVQDSIANVPPQVTLQIVNGTFIGGSPALVVKSGRVIVLNSTFTNATPAPTILVAGGSLILRDDTIQESTGYDDAAISVTGGTLDLGTASDPGGNTININGSGTFLRNTTGNPIAAVGDTFEMTVTTNSSLMLAGNNPPPLTGAVNGTPFTGTISYPTGFGGSVTVTLSAAATSASAVGQYRISAQLSGPNDGNSYVINPATSTTGTMYVVSVGTDPTDPTHVESVTFWDNKGNAKLITAADLSSLDALNLVTQGGSAFDPRSVAQLEAWLSISPNATAAYQLAVQLAVMDLNVLADYVKATDVVYAGGLLPYATADNIAGLTSGGFLDVQDLIQAANVALAQVSPGNPSGDPNAAYELALAQALQAANSNSDFVTQELIWGLLGL